MCLYVKDDKFIIAERDIRCYKILQIQNGGLITPFYEEEVKTKTLKAKGRIGILRDFLFEELSVSEGMIHTISNLKDAKLYLKWCRTFFWKLKGAKLIIAKAIIPKGTKYIKGDIPYFSDRKRNAIGYASKKIILDEKPSDIIARYNKREKQ